MHEATDNQQTNKSPVGILARLRQNWHEFLNNSKKNLHADSFTTVLLWLVFVRLAILSIILAFSFFATHIVSATTTAAATAIIYGISLLNIYIIRRSKQHYRVGYAQLVLDVILISLSIYFADALELASLYLLVVVGSSVLLNLRGAIVISCLCALCYTAFTAGLFTSPTSDISPSSTDVLFGYLSLVAISFISSFIARKIERLNAIAHKSQQDLSQLSDQQREMLNQLKEGIVVIDSKSMVVNINEAAKSIVKLSEINAEQIIGKDFQKILTGIGVEHPADILLPSLNNEDSELSLLNSSEEDEMVLQHGTRCLFDSQGNEYGKLIMFRDISHERSMEEKLSLHEKMAELLATTTMESTGLFGNTLENGEHSVKIIGESSVIKEIFSLIQRVSQSDASVLVHGESGTGKELIARAIHVKSPRRDKPFIAINCSAIPENLIESELFGHKKGSFTGAIDDNLGLFREANKGTIFLDEIGDLPLGLQAKLLRTLQEKKVRAVGDIKDTPVDVRIIAATHKNLKEEIQSKNFREDLFYRLNVVSMVAPPLRDRKQDISLLVRYFLEKYAPESQTLPKISPEALGLLNSYNFPGNIRELENIIERAIVLGGQAILPEHLPDEVKRKRSSAEILAQANGAAGDDTTVMELPIDLEKETGKARNAIPQYGSLRSQWN